MKTRRNEDLVLAFGDQVDARFVGVTHVIEDVDAIAGSFQTTFRAASVGCDPTTETVGFLDRYGNFVVREVVVLGPRSLSDGLTALDDLDDVCT